MLPSQSTPLTQPRSQPPVIEKPSFKKDGSARWRLPFGWYFLALVLAAGVWWQFWPEGEEKKLGLTVNSKTYQGVFLSNGQVYFGQITGLEEDYLKLTNIYYLRLRESLQTQGKIANEKEADQGEPTLVKFGTELHQPKDFMLINRDQILFIEELEANSKVAQAITDNIKKKEGK